MFTLFMASCKIHRPIRKAQDSFAARWPLLTNPMKLPPRFSGSGLVKQSNEIAKLTVLMQIDGTHQRIPVSGLDSVNSDDRPHGSLTLIIRPLISITVK